jgi:butyryl-CoA dehydrogenase
MPTVTFDRLDDYVWRRLGPRRVLAGRKTVRDGGQTAKGVLARVRETLAQMPQDGGDLSSIAEQLEQGADALEAAIDHLVAQGKGDARAVYAGSVPYLMLCGTVLAGWQMARAALRARTLLEAGDPDSAFLKAKIGTARFYAGSGQRREITAQRGALV